MGYKAKNRKTPPRWATHLLEWYCHPDLLEEIQGDMNEVYHEHVSRKRYHLADITYIIQVILFFRISNIRNITPNFSTMILQNYLKIAFRSFWKHKGHAAINLLGLSVAMSAFMLIFLYLRFQYSFNKNFPDSDRVYIAHEIKANKPQFFEVVGKIVPELEANPYVEVICGTRLMEAVQDFVVEEQRFTEVGLYVDTAFFQVFEFDVLAGDPHQIFRSTNSVVISQSLADKYFPDQYALNQTIEIGFTSYTVTAIMQDIPQSMSFRGDYLLPFSIVESWGFTDWYNGFSYSVFKLTSKEASTKVANAIEQMVKTHVDEPAEVGDYALLPIHEFHLFDESGSKKRMLTSLWLIGGALLLIACINFANLMMVQSLSRTLEVGIRMILGARRKQVISQFLVETLLLSLTAVLLGFALVKLTLPHLRDLIQQPLELSILSAWEWVTILLGLGIGVGLLTGLYPAWYQLHLRLADTLKGKIFSQPQGISIKNVLVATQFTLAIVIILGTFIVWKQIQYMKQREIGVHTENIYTIRATPYHFKDQEIGISRIKRMKEALQRNPDIVQVSSSQSIPSEYIHYGADIQPAGAPEKVWVKWTNVDANYFQVFGMNFIEGRNFSDSLQTDIDERVIINVTARDAFGWDSAVGKTIRWGDEDKIVIGVVADYFYQSLAEKVEPLVHFFRGNDAIYNYRFTSVEIIPTQIDRALPLIEEEIQKLDPNYTFNSFFVDQHFEELYRRYEVMGTLAGIFSFVAILIACLGLLGLAAYNAQQRTKEIGVRKILGASLIHLLGLLVRQITFLVIIGVVLAIPLAYILMRKWLEDFAYRTSLNAWIFVVAGIFILIIAWLTVSYHVFKVARANPVESLRME